MSPSGGPPFDVVFFDCDSTLSAIEGIDELGRWAGLGDTFAALTRDAMEGRVSLEAVYSKRLEAVRPDRATIDRLAQEYVDRIVPGAAETIGALHALGKDVRVVSGGLREAVLPLALSLGILEERVHAVGLRFAPDGSYAGFDEDSPLARSGGKRRACAAVLGGARRGAMVGDGVTDLEAAPPCDLVVGFGGVVAREPVRAAAGAWVAGPSLAGTLHHLLSREEREDLEALERRPPGRKVSP